MLDKRPALEYLVDIDRKTGVYIPELAETWEMSPDGKTWTITLRKGVKFHEHWGEFTARDVHHRIVGWYKQRLNPEEITTEIPHLDYAGDVLGTLLRRPACYARAAG